MISGITHSFRQTTLYSFLRSYRQKNQYQQWLRYGKPIPPPHLVKQDVIKEFARKFDIHVFIETGTYMGDMVYAVRNTFEEIHTIELDRELHCYAKRRVSRYKHISVYQGDSGLVLGDLLTKVNQPCLFWLDGHYSAGLTAKGELETPVEKELSSIAQHRQKSNHVILIDDANCFTGKGDYPDIQSLRQWATHQDFNSFDVKENIIRIFNIN